MKTRTRVVASLVVAAAASGIVTAMPVAGESPSTPVEIAGMSPTDVTRLLSSEEMVYTEKAALAYALNQPGLGGFHFDASGRAVFSYTEVPSGVAERFSAPELVGVRQVRYSLGDLEAFLGSLESLRPFVRGQGGDIEYLGISETDNVVRAGISGSSSSSSATIIDSLLEELPSDALDAYDLVVSSELDAAAR